MRLPWAPAPAPPVESPPPWWASTLSTPTTAVEALDLVALAIFVVVLVAVSMQYRDYGKPLDAVFLRVARALGSKCETWDDWLYAHGPDLGTLRNSFAMVVVFFLFESRGPCAAHWGLITACTLCIWDFGFPMSAGPWLFAHGSVTRARIYLQLFMHHFGTVIPLVFQAFEDDPGRARLNTIYVPYLWISHGFPQLQNWMGFEHGKKYQSLEIMRYAYGAVSVLLLWLYIAHENQPGLGMNYQSAFVLVLLPGRQGFGIEFNIPWMRYFELPGVFLVFAAALYRDGKHALAAVPLAMLVALKLYVYITNPKALTEEYLDKLFKDEIKAKQAADAIEATNRGEPPKLSSQKSKAQMLRSSLSGMIPPGFFDEVDGPGRRE